MNLHLVQHVEAKPESVDPEPRLSEQARADIWRMARFAAEHLAIQTPQRYANRMMVRTRALDAAPRPRR